MKQDPARVLVVDDDARNRKLLRGVVESEGFEAIGASGGSEALSIIERERVDLVLLDLMMPEVDGITVLRTLRERGRLQTLPVVVVTADEDRATRWRALSAGAIDFLTKPVDWLEVACKLRALTELSRHRSQALEQVRRSAASDQLSRVEQAVEGLPLIIFEIRPDQAEGSWVVGDMAGLSGVTGTTFPIPLDAWFELLHPDDRADVRQELRRIMEHTEPRVSVRFRMQLGGVWRWRLGYVSQQDQGRSVRGVVLGIDDQVALEERLRQAQKMEAVGQLAGGIAHDFGNIIGAILAFAGFARDGLPEGDLRRDDIDEVIKAAERAVGLTRQLLTFSRRQPLAKVPTSLNARLAQLRPLLAQSLTEQVALDIQLPAEPAVVRIDPVQFDQVLLNLAVNARDAMPDGGALRIHLSRVAEPGQPAQAVLAVTDTGIGMDDATRERIFEPFFTSKPRGRGTGLGLSTCFGIVQDCGGNIAVQSAPGEGTTFTIHLPVHDGAETTASGFPRVERYGGGELVLLAEDDDALRRVAAKTLEAAGYRVRQAADGDQAIRLIDELGPELRVIVSDLVMPGSSGFEVAAYAAHALPRTRVVLTTGYVDESLDRKGLDDLPILWKPVAPAELLRSVGDAVGATAGGPGEITDEQSARVLVVEDHEPTAAAVCRVLRTAGYEPLAAATLAEARARLTQDADLCALLCDLSLPDGHGADFLLETVDGHPHLEQRCIVMTGGAVDAKGRKLIRSRRFSVLEKPLRPQRLIDALGGLEAARNAPPGLRAGRTR